MGRWGFIGKEKEEEKQPKKRRRMRGKKGGSEETVKSPFLISVGQLISFSMHIILIYTKHLSITLIINILQFNKSIFTYNIYRIINLYIYLIYLFIFHT